MGSQSGGGRDKTDLVQSLQKPEVILAIQLIVMSGEPVGEGEGVVHERGVEDWEEGRGSTQ